MSSWLIRMSEWLNEWVNEERESRSEGGQRAFDEDVNGCGIVQWKVGVSIRRKVGNNCNQERE